MDEQEEELIQKTDDSSVGEDKEELENEEDQGIEEEVNEEEEDEDEIPLDDNITLMEYSAEAIKVYKEQRQATRQKLLKQIQEYEPYDFAFLLNVIQTILEDMEEYYATGIKVMQNDESRLKVAQQIQEALNALKAYRAVDYGDGDDYDAEGALIKSFFCLIGDNILNWWD